MQRKDGFVSIKLKSFIPDLYIIGAANFEGNIFSEETYHLVNHETVIKIPLKEEFKNVVTINFESVFENERFDNILSVILKADKPELKFDVDTFRSKIEPGSNENWSFKLTGTSTKRSRSFGNDV